MQKQFWWTSGNLHQVEGEDLSNAGEGRDRSMHGPLPTPDDIYLNISSLSACH